MCRYIVSAINKTACVGVGIIIRLYQLIISPWLGHCCRFYPSCSEYAKQSFEKKGFFCGLWLASWRLLRCQPLCKGGYDPVP